jgi:putative sterol carrier protein
MSEVKAILDGINGRLTDDVKANLDAVIGVQLDGTEYTIDARKIGAGVLEGAPSAHGLEPRFSLAASEGDFVKIVRGELNPMMAAMTGKLKISGDMGFAMKLTSLFN